MGSSCTLPARDHLVLPSRVVKIEQNANIVQRRPKANTAGPLLHKMSTKSGSQSPSTSIRSTTNIEAPTAVDLDEEPKTRNYESYRLSAKYDPCELGIGKHYLSKEVPEAKGKKPNTKSKIHARNEVTWDKIVAQMRVIITQAEPDNPFYNEVGVLLKEFSLIKPKMFNKMLDKGLPMRYRWLVWKNTLNVEQFYMKGLYEKFKNLSSRWEKDIRKDIHRTFPCEPFFTSKKHDNIGQQQLFNTLKAASLYFPNIGYVQGMNFLMGYLLLLSGGNELEAFWAFVTMVRDHKYLMMGFFEKGFPLLEFYLYVFYKILEEELPLVYEHLKSQQIPDQLWVFKWFLTVFLYSVPDTHTVKIWDFIIRYGLFSMIRVAVGIVKYFENNILELDSFGMDQFLKHLRGENSKSKKGRNLDRSNVNGNQSVINNESATIQNNIDIENNGSVHETSEFCYNFKEVNIEEILQMATKINLSLGKISQLVEGFTTTTKKKLPDLYLRFLVDIENYDQEKQKKFQEELDFYIIKSELSEELNEEIVVSNLMNDADGSHVLNNLDL